MESSIEAYRKRMESIRSKRKPHWEVVFKHEKALRDAQALSQGFELPKDEPYGVLYHIDKLWWRFSGSKFWTKLNELGHDSMDLLECKCSKP